jgi:Flp pilus assembly protein TadG
MKYMHRQLARRGAVIPMVALLLIPLLAMMAFSIDIGYAVAVQAELVNAADAASLAGVQQLYSGYQQWQSATGSAQTTIYNNAISSAKATAIAVANANKAGGATCQIVSSDVDVGYTSNAGQYYSGNQGQIAAGSFPNTVVITVRRDNTGLPNSNGEVSLFFAPVIGKASQALSASAYATAYEGTITSLQSNGMNGTLLPIAVDMTQWTDFFNNGASSVYADPNAPSGQAWLQIYPGGTGSSMDGLLSLNGSKAAAETYYSGNTGWIQGGPSSSDISGLSSAGELPLPLLGAGETWASGPGMKSSLLGDFQAVVSSSAVRLLPLYDPSAAGTTGGGNGTYQVVYFVPVYMVYAQGNGKANMDIAVSKVPANPITDPTAVITNVAPMGTSSTHRQYVVPVAAKLSK